MKIKFDVAHAVVSQKEKFRTFHLYTVINITEKLLATCHVTTVVSKMIHSMIDGVGDSLAYPLISTLGFHVN